MVKKIYNNKKLFVFLLSTLLGILIVLPNIVAGKGIYYLIDDFNFQQIPFNMINNYLIKKGNFNFTWFNDFGSSFIPTYSFYNLFSPFNIIGYLFPDKIYPYLIGPIFILKYGFTGLASFLFLKRYVRNKDYAVLGSLLYTFSGFQFVNILFYHFHDAVCLFPLLLYTLDNLVYENKRVGFLLVVFLCSITNWFFFIEEVIFLLIYYIIKVITGEYKFTIKSFLCIFLEGLLGTLMSMFILIPTYLFTSGNPRLGYSWNIFSIFRYYPDTWYLEIIKSFIFPTQSMSLEKRAMIMPFNYSSLDLYLPLVGFLFTLSYAVHNLRKSTTIISFTSMIIMFIPILNSVFVLFNTSNYYRWVFMPILIMSLMSVKCIENKESIKLSSILISFISLMFIIIIFIKRHSLVYITKYTIIIIFIGLLGIIISNYIYNNKTSKRLKYFFIFVSLYIIFCGNFIVFQYKYPDDFRDYKDYVKYNKEFESISNVRTNSSVSCYSNLSNVKHIHNIASFNSNTFGTVFDFIDSVTKTRDVYTIIPIENKRLNDFLGVRYVIGCDNDNPSLYGYKYYKSIDNYRIYINDNYKEFGSSYNDFISTKEYYSLKKEDRIKILNNRIVLDNEQIKKYSYLYPNEVKYKTNDFKFLDNGFSSTIVSNKETIAVYQIPYDIGWKATINGKKVEIEKVDVGFIGIKINEGKNNIKFEYVTPGLKLGIIISIISLIFSSIYIMYISFSKN